MHTYKNVLCLYMSYMQVVEALTLTEVFRDNPVLCNKVRESEVQHFFRCIEKDRDVRYLLFLQTIIKVNGAPLKRSQDLVMGEVREILCVRSLRMCFYCAGEWSSQHTLCTFINSGCRINQQNCNEVQ